MEAFAPLFSSFQCWLEELKIVLIPEGLSVLKFHSDMPWGWSVSSTGLGAQWALLIWQLSSFYSGTFSKSYLNSFHPSILSVSLSETPFRQMLDVLVQSYLSYRGTFLSLSFCSAFWKLPQFQL